MITAQAALADNRLVLPVDVTELDHDQMVQTNGGVGVLGTLVVLGLAALAGAVLGVAAYYVWKWLT